MISWEVCATSSPFVVSTVCVSDGGSAFDIERAGVHAARCPSSLLVFLNASLSKQLCLCRCVFGNTARRRTLRRLKWWRGADFYRFGLIIVGLPRLKRDDANAPGNLIKGVPITNRHGGGHLNRLVVS